MGYYSSVAFATYKKNFLELLAEARADEAVPGCITEMLTGYCSYLGIVDGCNGGDAVVVVRWDSIKWYDSFDSVFFMERWMNRAESEGIPFEFARCGEEYEDIEIRSYGDDHIGYGEFVGVVHEVCLLYNGTPYEPVIPDLENEEKIEPPDLDGLLADGA